MAIVTAFFSNVCEHTVAAQPRMIELTPYVPMVKMHMAMYRPAVVSVAGAIAKPTMARPLQAEMCQVRSLYLPELSETRMEKAPAMRYGGQVRTRPIV